MEPVDVLASQSAVIGQAERFFCVFFFPAAVATCSHYWAQRSGHPPLGLHFSASVRSLAQGTK